MNTNINFEKLKNDAIEIFNGGYACSESVIYAIRKNFEVDIPDDAIAMSSGFPWGLRGGCLCGALAGGTMALGYLFGRRNPGESQEVIFRTTKELHDHFKKTNGATCCRILTKDFDMMSPERKAHCTKMVVDTVQKTAELILKES
ncbi:MAG: C-GCAxxG-C-C family protein [Suipraeoptans sp.]